MSARLAITRWLLATMFLLVLMIACAGWTNPPLFQVYLILFVGVELLIVILSGTSLGQERCQPDRDAVDPSARPLASLLFLITVAVAAVDSGRFHRIPDIPRLVQVAGFLTVAFLGLLRGWAMAVNPFFSTVIRLQTERGHHVITHGPYRFVRHPGYLAMLFTMPLTALALGSWFALIPATLYDFVILKRTMKEDRFLQENLGGYANYAKIICYRLIPGIW